ncbi:fucolectin-like [Palaemon carinicauda]|uniref:fucolectin-like n=1 Tax=Palaemon carinicauda TaxID=392227 RepID=UPI0035B60378
MAADDSADGSMGSSKRPVLSSQGYSLFLAVVKGFPEVNLTHFTLTDGRQDLVASNISSALTGAQWQNYSQVQPSSVLVGILSSVLCSFEAKRARAPVFSFEGQICSLFSSGGSTPNEITIYKSFLLPPGEPLEEVARGKPTDASPFFSTTTQSMEAVDGDITDSSMYHSTSILKPWWRVDLGEERIIYQIQILPRQSAYERFHDVEVRVGTTAAVNGNFSSYNLLCTYTKIYALSEGHLLCSRYTGVVGRYVSIQIVAAVAEFLQINEINVYALQKEVT